MILRLSLWKLLGQCTSRTSTQGLSYKRPVMLFAGWTCWLSLQFAFMFAQTCSAISLIFYQ